MLVYQLCVTALLLGVAGNFILNLLFFRRPQTGTAPPAGVRVSVLVPARNEASRIRPCLDSLLKQDYPYLELIVLDDHSTDATAAIVAEYSRREPRLVLIQGEALPSGWTGKAWACSQLARAARGDFFLFTDADTVHEENSVSAALGCINRREGDLLSLWPGQITVGWAEVLAVPFVNLLHLFFLPHWMPGRWRSLGAANGQFMLFRRDAYKSIGGHEAVRGHLVEDVALAREIKVRGMKLINVNGCSLVHCRMYEDAGQVWEGFGKNLRAGCEGSVLAFLVLTGLQAALFLGPFVCVLIAPWCLTEQTMALVLFQMAAVWGLRFWAALVGRQSLLGALLHPVGQFYFLMIAFFSWYKYATGAVTWKGRNYTART